MRTLLDDKRPWQGNRLQQLKPQLDTLQQAIANQLASEKANAEERLIELEHRLQAADEYARLQAADQAALSQAFADARQALQGQKRIAMIRDQLRRFEDERFPQLLSQLDQLARPVTSAPSSTPIKHLVTEPAVTSAIGTSPSTARPAAPPAEPKLVPARTIKVSYAKPWLANEAELDDYLQKQREAWLKEIQAGNRVQI